MSEIQNAPSVDISSSRALTVTFALLVDAVMVLIFIAVGRGQHGQVESLTGLWATAWPFLAGLAVAWLAGMVWRRPTAVLRSGVVVWIGTVVLGLLFRELFTDGGIATAFIIVATLTLAVLFLGWRLVTQLVLRYNRG